MEDFKAIKRRRLSQDIVGQIQEFIRAGILKPGDRFPAERELAERLEVSRSSLREAMRALELQGLVVSRPGAGTFVSAESLDTLLTIMSASVNHERETLDEIFEVRHLLEPQIVVLAAERATPQDIERMEKALDEQEAQISMGETGVDGDTAFHFAMAQAARNSALVKVISTIADILRESRDQSLQTPGRPQRSLTSHRHVLDMIRRKDAEGAREAMEYHLSDVEAAHFAPDEKQDSGHPAMARSS